MERIKGRLVDTWSREIYPAIIAVDAGKIIRIERTNPGEDTTLPFILPGFVDAHVHIESSMLVPSQFARLAVRHGTVATVSDPHEIANVCGIEGVRFMIADGKKALFKFYFGAPSCVPASTFETAGATLGVEEVTQLLEDPSILYLSEMMNFPGVLYNDPDVMQKIAAAKRLNKPVDGHAPGLRSDAAQQYAAAGISTDHECYTLEEALDKLRCGMKIIIREGSAARNFEALVSLVGSHPGDVMFCSDDKHPDSLVEGHINDLCARAVAQGYEVFDVLQAACVNPVLHYRLAVGLLREGDPADFILVEDLQSFKVVRTFINGSEAYASHTGSATGTIAAPPGHSGPAINNFDARPVKAADFAYTATLPYVRPVILAEDGQIVTGRKDIELKVDDGVFISDPSRDVLKIAVVNRYHPAPVATAFIQRFALQRGAIASSVAHDSHNIIVVGVDDDSMAAAVNLIIEHKGGVSAVGLESPMILPLPVAGLMSAEDGDRVARAYQSIDRYAKALGSKLSAPFMTLSFMALLVIPSLKLSDKGLFDGDAFRLID